jgi:hypothetical protein
MPVRMDLFERLHQGLGKVEIIFGNNGKKSLFPWCAVHVHSGHPITVHGSQFTVKKKKYLWGFLNPRALP